MQDQKPTESRRERRRANPTAPNDTAAHPNGAAGVDAPTPEMVNNEMKRLMHRVAWSRMFGHGERRNPYEK